MELTTNAIGCKSLKQFGCKDEEDRHRIGLAAAALSHNGEFGMTAIGWHGAPVIACSPSASPVRGIVRCFNHLQRLNGFGEIGHQTG